VGSSIVTVQAIITDVFAEEDASLHERCTDMFLCCYTSHLQCGTLELLAYVISPCFLTFMMVHK
jgi:hypothetical protein